MKNFTSISPVQAYKFQTAMNTAPKEIELTEALDFINFALNRNRIKSIDASELNAFLIHIKEQLKKLIPA
jgi:hypothetical protein